jgi:hypothetical protein
VAITNGGGGTLSGLAVAVAYTAGQPTGWLVTATLDQTTAPATLTLRPSQTGLAVGTYTATVTITATAASNSPRTITVTFVVADTPTLVVGTNTVSVSATRNALHTPGPVAVTRQGGGTIAGLSATISYQNGSGWLSATLSSTSAPATLTIQANATGLTLGQQYVARVLVATPNAGSSSPQTITVTLTVLYSFANDILPALAPYCINCPFQGGNTPNLSASVAYDNLVNAPTFDKGYPLATTYPLRVKPGDATQSYLMYQVQKNLGANPMPTSAATVPSQIIDALRAWINQGAQRN